MRRSVARALLVGLPLCLWGCPQDKEVDARSKLARANDQPIVPQPPAQVRPPDPVVEPITAEKVDRYLEFQEAFTVLLAAQVDIAEKKKAAAKADGSRDAKAKLDADLEAISKVLSDKRVEMLEARGLTDVQGRRLSALIGEMTALKGTLDPALAQMEKARNSMGMLPESQRADLLAQLKERQQQLEQTGRMSHAREVLGDVAVDAMVKRRDAAIAGYEKQLATLGTFSGPSLVEKH
jgi:hypothetical protein